MKRFVCAMLALAVCVLFACPVFAAEFTDSVGYKDHPEVVGTITIVGDNSEPVSDVEDDCLIITPISEAEDSDQIPEDAKQELLDIYEKLTDGTMKLPYGNDEDWVIRDLFDVSLICNDGHAEELEQEGNSIVLTFDLGVSAGEEVVVMVYVDGGWTEVPTVNNGDGTITSTFEKICPVTISVLAGSHEPPAQTGDNSGIMMWVALALLSSTALVALVVFRRKIVR